MTLLQVGYGYPQGDHRRGGPGVQLPALSRGPGEEDSSGAGLRLSFDPLHRPGWTNHQRSTPCE